MHNSLKTLATTVVILCATQAQSSDFNPTHFLATKCAGCHGDEVYSRPNHRMQDLKQLEGQVRRCDANVGTSLFDDDIETLVKYLDNTYYHF